MKYFQKLSQWPKHSDKNHKKRLIHGIMHLSFSKILMFDQCTKRCKLALSMYNQLKLRDLISF